MFWAILMLIVVIVLIFLIVYLTIKFRKLFCMKIENKILSYLVALIPIVIVFLTWNYMNSVVILFHLVIFILISNLVFKFINKNRKKKDKISENIITICGLICGVIYLGIGLFLDYHVFETTYNVYTNKDMGVSGGLKILQISDSHVGTTFNGKGFSSHVDRMNKVENIDAVVITGDFVDDDTTYEDMVESCKALSKFNTKYGVYFIYGNHDKGYYNYRNFDDNDLRNELSKNNVVILEDEVVELNDYVYLIGRQDGYVYDRTPIKELVSNLDKEKFSIVLNHEPNDYKNERESNVDLVLSGHTHGGQLFPLGYIGLLLKQNDMFKGIKKIDNTTFIVNTGISDWAMDFKTGTKSEYTIINIIGSDKNGI